MKKVQFCGKEYDSLKYLVSKFGNDVSYDCVYKRITRSKWSVEDSITTPKGSKNVTKSLGVYYLYHLKKYSVKQISYMTGLTQKQIYEILKD